MRVNSDLSKHFGFLTVESDDTHGFLYSMVLLISKSEVRVFPRGGEFLWLVQIGRICVVIVCPGIIYQLCIKFLLTFI